MEKIKFLLNGCDIEFVAEAPKDITLEQLLKQTTRIKPDWCACGIRALERAKPDERFNEANCEAQIIIDYNDIRKANEDVSCKILDYEDIRKEFEIYE
jgi:hypothetical protein